MKTGVAGELGVVASERRGRAAGVFFVSIVPIEVLVESSQIWLFRPEWIFSSHLGSLLL